MASNGDECLKCGESRGAIRNERLNYWDGYDELGRHRYKPWPTDSETESETTNAE